MSYSLRTKSTCTVHSVVCLGSACSAWTSKQHRLLAADAKHRLYVPRQIRSTLKLHPSHPIRVTRTHIQLAHLADNTQHNHSDHTQLAHPAAVCCMQCQPNYTSQLEIEQWVYLNRKTHCKCTITLGAHLQHVDRVGRVSYVWSDWDVEILQPHKQGQAYGGKTARINQLVSWRLMRVCAHTTA